MKNFLKGLGIVILLAVGFVIYEVTGPHSPEAVVGKMESTLAEAQRLAMNGDIWFDRALSTVGTSQPDKCKFNFTSASVAYHDAYNQYTLLQGYSDKLSKWDEPRSLLVKQALAPKLTKLESRLKLTSDGLKGC